MAFQVGTTRSLFLLPHSSHFAFEKATSPFRRSTADMAKGRSAKVCWKLKTFHPLFEYILAGQPSCPSLSIVFRLWWSFGGAWCFKNNSKRQYWRTTIHHNKKHFLKKRIAIYKKKRKGKGQIFLKNIFLVQLSPFIDRLYLSQPNWVLHLWATGSINHPFSATLKRSVNLSHD